MLAIRSAGSSTRGEHMAAASRPSPAAATASPSRVGESQDRTIVGDAPMLAARLQALVQPDMVAIGPTTRLLIGDLFDCRDLGAIGVERLAGPVPAWQVMRASAIASRFEALRGSPLTRLVGRGEEIDLLLRRWSRAKAGDGQVVLVSGEPGIGKSRLCAELEARLDAEPHSRLRYFCSPYYPDRALFPFIDQLGRAAGFARDDPPAAKLEKLEALLGPAVPEEDVALLADLMLLRASEHHPLPNLSPQRKKERTLAALTRKLEGLARQQPVIMVFEDAQWSDPTSQELLDLIIERVRSLPVLLIVTFRPEFEPQWTGQPRVTMLALNRLDWRDRTVLVAQLAGGKALPDGVVKQIADRTDDIPLFVEELTKSVLESGVTPLGIPTTLHDSLMARLDRLGPVKPVAQIGAAIGRDFSYALLRAVSRVPEDELQASLARLAASELVFQRGVPPDAIYSFKHALVQDAAHDSLLRSPRRQLHAGIATALEALCPEMMDSQPELFAQHYAEAGLADKSALYWTKGGHRSAARSAMAEAATQFQKGFGSAGAFAGYSGTPATGDRASHRLGRCLNRRQGTRRAGDEAFLRPRARAVGAAGLSLGVPGGSVRAVCLPPASRRIRYGTALGRGFAAREPLAQRSRQARARPLFLRPNLIVSRSVCPSPRAS